MYSLLHPKRSLVVCAFGVAMAFLGTSCGVEVRSTVPDAPVYYELDFTSSQAAPLREVAGCLQITERTTERSAIGFGGLLIVHGILDADEYYAYDLACPHEAQSDVLLKVNDKLEAECPQCHSTYSIFYGGGVPTTGPAQSPLKNYMVTRSARGLLIHNRY